MDTDVDLELALSPHHPDLDDRRFDPQIVDLTEALNEEVGGVRLETKPEPGQRGGMSEIILALGTSGAIGAFVAVLRSWLDRDKARNVSIKVRTKGRAQTVEITANAANLGELEKLLTAARSRR